MKNVLKVLVLVLIVFCMVVSCSKKAGSSNNADGIEVIVSSNDGSSVSSGGSSSASAAGNDNTIRNVVGGIEHEKDDIVFFNWAGIPWADFGLSAAPAEPAGGKFETAYITKYGYPYIFISNVSKAAYEKLCREMEAGFNKEGEINENVRDGFIFDLGLDRCDERFDIPFGAIHRTADLYAGDRVYIDQDITRFYTFRIYYYDSPVNGIIMTLFSESML